VYIDRISAGRYGNWLVLAAAGLSSAEGMSLKMLLVQQADRRLAFFVSRIAAKGG